MTKIVSNIKKFLRKQWQKTGQYIDKRPFASFFVILGLLLVAIVISNIFGTKQPAAEEKNPEPKPVAVFTVGSAPKMAVQAQIEKSGVIHLNALTPGVVSSIPVQIGQHVSKGQVLFRLGTNYQGGNSASLQRQLAQTQYQNTLDTFDLQKELISKQRALAEKSDENADQMREITDQSLKELNSLIDLNSDILASIDSNLTNLEDTNVGGANDALILATKQLKSQFLAANNQAKQASRSAQLSSASDRPPTQLSDLQKELTLKQLDLQEKMLDMNKEISRIQLQIARVAEAMMYPTTPFNGTIQRIFVKPGQQVNPGTELAILSQDVEEDPIVAIAYVSADIAKKISKLEPSLVHIGNQIISAYPSYITQDAIQGQLYGVYFDIADQYSTQLTEKGSIQVDLPLGYFDTAAAVPYIPIDAVYQTKNDAYVYVITNGKAEAKSIELGNVYGSSVEVLTGLSSQDQVILDRNVLAGDSVTTQ